MTTAKLRAAVAVTITLAGCAAPPLTDPASPIGPGRYEVTLPGAGITQGGILFRPATQSPAAAVIVLHGWGPAGQPGAPRVESLARRLSEEGYVGLALSMRGWPPSGGDDDCGLEQPADVVRAAEWLASLPGVAADRIGVVGLSQGGQVALLAAARSSRIKAVVAYFPVTDIERWGATTTNPGIRDQYVPRTCRPGAPRSPLQVADRIGAAVLLVHGDADTRVPTEQSVRMAEAMRRAGRSVELQIVRGAEHGFALGQAGAGPRDFLARELRKSQ